MEVALRLESPSWASWSKSSSSHKSESVCVSECDSDTSSTFTSPAPTVRRRFQPATPCPLRSKSVWDLSRLDEALDISTESLPETEEDICEKYDEQIKDVNEKKSVVYGSATTPLQATSVVSCDKGNKLQWPQLTKSMTDVSRTGCSNVTARSKSYLRRCSSVASARSSVSHVGSQGSAMLDRMLAQLERKGIQLPSNDRKIMELMVARHQAELDERADRHALNARWQEERALRSEYERQTNVRHRQHVLNKRHSESVMQELKRAERSKEEEQDTRRREIFISAKTQKWTQGWLEQQQAKRESFHHLMFKEMERKKAQEKQLQERLEEDELSRQLVSAESNCRLVRSIQSKQVQEMQNLVKIRQDNEAARQRHLQRMQEIDEDFNWKMDVLQEEMNRKESQALTNYETCMRSKETMLKRRMEEREERLGKIRDVIEEMESKKRHLSQEHLHSSHVALEMAAYRMRKSYEDRRSVTRRNRVSKTIKHSKKMNGIINEEKRKQILATMDIKEKDKKCEYMAIKQRNSIQKSREVALASANLKDRLKRALLEEALQFKLPGNVCYGSTRHSSCTFT